MTARETAAAAADETAASRGRYAAVLVAIALFGLAIAGYLTVVKLSGGTPVCGPLGGCETVQTSEYSAVLGIPVSVYGLGYSLAVLVAILAWWRTGDRRALMAAYGIGILGVMAVAYLVYLQLVVIGAICVWCMAFDTTVVTGFIATVVAYRRTAAT